MTVADRIAVMDRGRLIQVAPPAEIYEWPNSRWVADFIGSVNLFEGRVGNDEATIEGTALGRLRAAGKINAEPGATVWVAVRPEKVRLIRYEVGRHEQAVAENGVAATVVDIGYLGDLSLYRLRTEAGVALQAAIANTEPLIARGIGWNDKVWLSFAPEAAIVLTR
jgi:putrescine transport system ATP-binding protein